MRVLTEYLNAVSFCATFQQCMHISRRAAECRRLPPLPRRLERSCTLRESSRISSLISSLAASTFSPILSPTSSTFSASFGSHSSCFTSWHSMRFWLDGTPHPEILFFQSSYLLTSLSHTFLKKCHVDIWLIHLYLIFNIRNITSSQHRYILHIHFLPQSLI